MLFSAWSQVGRRCVVYAGNHYIAILTITISNQNINDLYKL